MSICKKMPAARLVIFTTCQGEEDIYRAVKAGAYGYLLKDDAAERSGGVYPCRGAREGDGFHLRWRQMWESESLTEH